MLIKLLRDLPGAKAGETFEPLCGNEFVEIARTDYTVETLLSEGWAEEQAEEKKQVSSVWELEDGDICYGISDDLYVSPYSFCDWTTKMRKYNDVFLTKEEAEAELLRRESRAKARKPEEGERYWIREENGVEDTIWSGAAFDMMYFHNGNVHQTREVALSWGEAYGKAFGLRA